MAEPETHNPKSDGSNPVNTETAGTEGEKMVKKIDLPSMVRLG
jgi:hypothetical protein